MLRNAFRGSVFIGALVLAIAAAGLAVTAGSASAAPATCSGVIFQDYDADGERSEDYSHISSAYGNVLDDGVAGIAVAIATATGNNLTTTTGGDGSWSIGLDDADFPIRIDFSGLPAGWNATQKGASSDGLTQFVQTASDCGGGSGGTNSVGSAGIVAPGTFCENRPEIVTSCFLFGDVPGHDSEPALVSFTDGSADTGTFQETPYTVDATLGQVGTVFGVDTLNDGTTLAASFVKRHTRLGPTNNPTTIYRVQPNGNVGPWITVDPGAPNPHSGDSDGWENDFAAFDDVGRSGLGDIEVSPDGSTVYTVDLGRKLLVSIPVNGDGSAGAATTTPITASSTGAPCSDADIRPFGLGFDGNTLLVGVTCSAESSVAASDYPTDVTNGPALGDKSQLSAHVYAFNGGFSLRTNVPVPTASRGTQNGVADSNSNLFFRGQSDWRPWLTAPPFVGNFTNFPSGGIAYAQPLLSDIEIDGDDLVIGFMDLWGHQMGSNAFYQGADGNAYQLEQPLSSGDTVRAVATGSGGYTYPTSGADFTYDGDNFQVTHHETTLGASVQIPGRPYLISNAFDPIEVPGTWQSGGVEYFDNTSGDHLLGYRIYDGRNDVAVGTFEKAAGIGDVEAHCGVADIEVGDYVWFDADSDGIADPGEPALNGVIIELVDASGNVIATTTTDANGLYSFNTADVAGFDQGGNYSIVVAQANYDQGGVFNGGQHDGMGNATFPNAGSDDANDSDGELVNGLPTVSFTATNTDHTFDFGFVKETFQLGSTVFVDFDDNGVQDAGEPGIAGVEVQLLDDQGNFVASTVTDANGNYFFPGLEPGDYVVAIADSQQAAGAPLNGYESSEGNGTAPDPDDDVDLDDNGDPADGYASISAAVTIGDGEPVGEALEDGSAVDENSNLTVDFGFVPWYRLGDTVFLDDDNNGVQDAGEAGIAGVDVQLLDANGGFIASTTTDANGEYVFEDLAAGDYVVAISSASQPALAGLESSTGNGAAPDPDGDVDLNDNGDPAAGFASISAPVTLGDAAEPTGEVTEDGTWADALSNLTVDFGFYEPEPDPDPTPDPEPPVVPPVDPDPEPAPLVGLGTTVFFDDDNNGIQDAGEAPIAGVTIELLDSAGNVIATTTTDADGNYEFTGLPEGTYTVKVPASNFAAGGPLDGHVTSSGNDVAGTAPDANDDVDLDDNGFNMGAMIVSTPVELTAGDEPDGDFNPTVDFGFYVPPAPLVGLGTTVFFDDDNNGIQDAGEASVPGVTIELLDSAGNVIATTTTDADGNYQFTGLTEGVYTVKVPASNFAAGGPLEGALTSTGNDVAGSAPAADNNVDLDDNGFNMGDMVITSPVTLTAGDEPEGDFNPTVDFGFYAPDAPTVGLGTTVFFDENNDGVQDAGEAPIAGVTVQLLDANGNVVAMTTTDADGNYEFTGLPEGTYSVKIPATNFAAGAPLEGLATSTGNDVAGAPPAANDDVDLDDNGAAMNGMVVTTPIELTVGDEPEGDFNPTVDFGFYEPAVAPPVPELVGLGSTVFFDDDNNGVQDEGEASITGVEVQLIDENGNVIAMTITDADGNYEFTGLPEGTYTVKIPASNFAAGGPLEGFGTSTGNDVDGVTPPADGNIDGDDSGFEMDGMIVSSTIVLSAGEEPEGNFNPTVDFGFVAVAGPVTPEPPVEPAGLGSTVFFDENSNGIQDPGEPGVPGITVMVMDAATGEVVEQVTTDADGNYEVTGLAPGNYTVTFKDIGNRNFTRQNVGDDALDSDASADGSSGIVNLSPGEFNPTIDAGLVTPVTVSGPPLAFTGQNSMTLAIWAAILAMLGFVLVAVTGQREEEDILI